MVKVSVWSQFSSNHSSCYAIVGEFESVEKAGEVEKQLAGWMDKIFDEGGTPLDTLVCLGKFRIRFFHAVLTYGTAVLIR